MVNYLSWANTATSAITAVSPFTYRDGVTYLEKLEGLGAKVNEVIDQTNFNTTTEAADVKAINDKYAQLVIDWNATLTRLDPTAVRVLVQSYDGQLASLGTRVTAVEGKNTAQDTAIAGKADKAYVDTQDGATLASAKAYADGKDTAGRAYADTQVAGAKAYTDTSVSALSSVYERKDQVAADSTAAVQAALGSATAMRAAFDSRYATEGGTTWPARGRADGVFYISQYCNDAQKAGTATASPAIAQLLTEMDAWANGKSRANGRMVSGGVIVVDGRYLIDQPIFPRVGMYLRGTGTNASGFVLQQGNLLQVTSGQLTEHVVCENFSVDILSTGGSFLSMVGQDGSSLATEAVMTKSVFRGLQIITQSTSQAIVSIKGYAEFHSNQFVGCEFDRPTASVAPAMEFRPNAGNVMNSNVIREMWIHGHNTTGQPAIVCEPTAQGYMHNWTFSDICGEQNCAGLLYLGGMDYVIIRNCIDWDGKNTYTNAVIRVGKSAPGTNSANVFIEASGVPQDGSNIGYWVDVSPGTSGYVRGCRVGNSGAGKIRVGDRMRMDDNKPAFSPISANYTAMPSDEILFATTAGITITLPDPMACQPGTRYQIVNVASGNVTVVSENGRTIGGGASVNVTPGNSVRFITDGQYMSGSGAAMRWFYA